MNCVLHLVHFADTLSLERQILPALGGVVTGRRGSFPKESPGAFAGRSSRHDVNVNCATGRVYGKEAGESGMTFHAARR